jgi:dihydroorotate dehydrogenase (NAD+) catalytic subunit
MSERTNAAATADVQTVAQASAQGTVRDSAQAHGLAQAAQVGEPGQLPCNFDATRTFQWHHKTVVAGVEWKNPVGTASGTFNFDAVRWFYDVSQMGAVTTKGVSPVPWEGNPVPRTAETPAGSVNSVGLQNPGVDDYLVNDLPRIKATGATVITNVAGHSDDDYAQVVTKLADHESDMLEINVSCPNVSADGLSTGTDPVALKRLIKRLRPLTDKPMIVKLTPNVTDIRPIAEACIEGGADALSMINTFVGMRFDIRTGKPILANITGGVSGPCVHPMALAFVYKTRQAFPEIPIIGIGGISTGEDALEFLYAGANAVEVGSAALADPVAPLRIATELDALLDKRPELAQALEEGRTW